MIGNASFLEVPSFPSTCLISFDESLGSDHTRLILSLLLSFDAPPPSNLPGWKVTDDLHNKWVTQFRALIQLKPPLDVATSSCLHGVVDHGLLCLVVGVLDDNIRIVCSALFMQQKVNPRGLAWWNNSCHLAVAGLSGTHGEACRQAYIILHTMIHGAKQDWYEKLLEDLEVSIWDLAKWRHSCHQSALPPIRDTEGLTTDPPHIAEAFHAHFFPFSPVAPRVPCLTSPSPPLLQGPFSR
jgi:hypothetical protein